MNDIPANDDTNDLREATAEAAPKSPKRIAMPNWRRSSPMRRPRCSMPVPTCRMSAAAPKGSGRRPRLCRDRVLARHPVGRRQSVARLVGDPRRPARRRPAEGPDHRLGSDWPRAGKRVRPSRHYQAGIGRRTARPEQTSGDVRSAVGRCEARHGRAGNPDRLHDPRPAAAPALVGVAKAPEGGA